MSVSPLGLILAGGESRRFGAPKALATVAGEPIVGRVRAALAGVVDRVGIVANEPDLFADMGLPIRPDLRPGSGALGGVHTAVRWAADAGAPGALVAACDMPFIETALLQRLRDDASAGGAAVVVPASSGRRGVEPLCAYYDAACARAIESRLAAGDRRVIAFYDDVAVHVVPLDEVRLLGDPDRMFMNVNTPDDHRRAQSLAGTVHD